MLPSPDVPPNLFLMFAADWIVLDSLLKSAADFHAELVDAKRSAPALRCPRLRKKQKTKW